MSDVLLDDLDVEFFGDMHCVIKDKQGDRSVRLSVYDMYTKARRDVVIAAAIALLMVEVMMYVLAFKCDCDENMYEMLAWKMAWLQLYTHIFLYIAYCSVRAEIQLSGLSTIELSVDHEMIK